MSKAIRQTERDTCYFCNAEGPLQSHHIVPRRYDGSDVDENLVDLCPNCHDKLERLYDARFYDELGVTREVESLEGEQCNHNGCKAPATIEIESKVGPGYVFACDDHARCCVRGCDNDPVLRPVWGKDQDQVFLICDQHGSCCRSSCKNTATYAVNEVTRRTLCTSHIVEENHNE